jgi:CelD/BcsL family acetyltransferase involved in cellulose biosynthesis
VPDAPVIRMLRSTADLEAFAPAWRQLWSADSSATPFQSPEWLLPWWHQFGSKELRAVVLMRGEEPICFLPLYIYDDVAAGERKLMLTGVGTSDYLDGLFASPCGAAEVLRCVQAVLASDDWDTLSLTQLRSHSKLLQALSGEPGLAVRSFHTEEGCRMEAVMLASLPSKIRRNAMYYRNRARRQGDLELTIANDATCGAQFEDLVQLHGERWHQRGGAGVLADERVLASHREAVPQLQRAGILRLASLRLNTETIAMLYSLVDSPQCSARTEYFYLTAFSPKYAELRPGTLLLAEAIEHAAGEGIAHIDMLRGHEPYKQIWHLHSVPTLGIELHARDYPTALGGVAA